MRWIFVRLVGAGLFFGICLSLLELHPGIAYASPQSQAQIYWGSSISGSVYGPGYGNAPYDTRTWNLFESHAGKHTSILHWTQSWYASLGNGWQSFQTKEFDAVRQRGAIPFLSWGSWDSCCGPVESAFALRNIVNGAHYSYHGQTFDQYITNWAKAAKSWGHPFFLRFDQEMNGWWQFPWATAPDPKTGVTINGNTALDYVKAWRHVHRIFSSVGATNVTWVWCPDHEMRPTTPLVSLYPGNSYVDWTCLDGYNNSATNWQTFAQIFSGDSTNGFHNSYADITSLAPTKPLILGEWASLEAGDGGAKKAAWITDALTKQLPINFPKIKAVLWFNGLALTRDLAPYQIESTGAAQKAFASGIASQYYASNTFASFNTSPIAPLA